MATMANEEQRLFVVDEKVVVMEGEKIIKLLQINEAEIKQKVLQVIEHTKNEGQKVKPVTVFTTALEEITGIPFKHRTYKMSSNISIHESTLYRRFLKFICNEMDFSEKIKEQKIANIKRKKEKEIDVYFNARRASIAHHIAIEEKRKN